jgi:GNAT superfamily N-acetyltransferase
MKNEPTMVSVPATPRFETRPLTNEDVERVVAIDRASSGIVLRHFFTKRIAAALANPSDFVHVGVTRDGVLCGFAIAHVLRGEFGREGAVAVLDALAVEPESQARGIGRLLVRGLDEIMRRAGVRSLQTEVDWRHHELMHFLETSGFTLAPRIALERSLAKPLDEVSTEV